MIDLSGLITTFQPHEDSRRKIVDVTPRIKHFTIAEIDGLKLGNHYHRNTPESFYILDGKVHFKLEDTTSRQRAEYTAQEGMLIKMPLFVAHLVLPERKAQFLGMLGEDFNADDLNKYEITW